MGGAAMCSAWLITILAGFLVPLIMRDAIPQYISGDISGIFLTNKRIVIIAAGALMMTVLGFLDDRSPMSAKFKFSGQFVIAALVVTFAQIKVSIFLNSEIITWCLSVFWILLIVNALNFFDNMDGLASGIAGIAFFFFMLIAIIFKHYFIASLSAAGLGASMGFWFYNKSPASIFMGDSGSHFLGYTLAVTGAMTTYYQQGITQSEFAVLIPLFLLAIPLFDLLSVVVIRLKIKKPIYIGDNNHISHRFNKMGMTRKTAVLCVHLLAIIVSLGVLPVLWGDTYTATVCLIQACIILFLVSVLQYSAKKN
jgi:UDP-GlcNAc:undecaprenyl-phosphate GlcNAc-1-phosphate transferase